MVEALPVSIPAPTLDFSVGLVSPVIRTQFESKRVRQRNRFTSDLRNCPVRWKLTQEQWEVWQTFFQDTVPGAADYFLLDIQMGGGLQQYKARIIEGKYQEEYQEPFFLISATLEIEEYAVISEAELDYEILVGDLEQLEAATDHLHQLVHVTLPTVNTF